MTLPLNNDKVITNAYYFTLKFMFILNIDEYFTVFCEDKCFQN